MCFGMDTGSYAQASISMRFLIEIQPLSCLAWYLNISSSWSRSPSYFRNHCVSLLSTWFTCPRHRVCPSPKSSAHKCTVNRCEGAIRRSEGMAGILWYSFCANIAHLPLQIRFMPFLTRDPSPELETWDAIVSSRASLHGYGWPAESLKCQIFLVNCREMCGKASALGNEAVASMGTINGRCVAVAVAMM